jgi:hypothetical protein
MIPKKNAIIPAQIKNSIDTSFNEIAFFSSINLRKNASSN